MDFGKRMRIKREELGLTLNDLNKITNINVSVLSAIERGSRPVQLSKAVIIANALDTTVAELLGENSWSKEGEVLSNVEQSSILYELFLTNHQFPNGMTYNEMCKEMVELKKENEQLKNSK